MRLDRVVIGVDFSAASIDGTRWTARHFARDAALMLVHALEVPRPPSFLHGRFQSPEEIYATAREGAEARLRELAESLPASDVRSGVREGGPSDVITQMATDFGADLTVVGEHGRHRGVWSLLGTTAERLVRCCPTPVLIARRAPDAAPRRILAPIDGSDQTASVLDWARFLGERFDARVLAFHALDPVPFAQIEAVSSDRKAEQVEAEYHRQGVEWLERQIEEAGFDPERTAARVVVGEPRHEILAAQRRYGADLVVMGSRGAGAVERAFVGSVALGVLRGAASPVLVVRDEPCD